MCLYLPQSVRQPAYFTPITVVCAAECFFLPPHATTCSDELRGFPPGCGDSVADFLKLGRP